MAEKNINNNNNNSKPSFESCLSSPSIGLFTSKGQIEKIIINVIGGVCDFVVRVTCARNVGQNDHQVAVKEDAGTLRTRGLIRHAFGCRHGVITSQR